MGDRGQARKQHIVKAGESYESIFGRSFGDALRHFGGKTLNPGDVLDLSNFQRHKDPFVSASDVAYSQKSNGANYRGPQMQQYGDFVKNYNAAIAEGYKGVRGSPYQGAGANAGQSTAAPTTGPYAPGGVNDPARPAIAPNFTPGQTGQQAAANWQTQKAAQPKPAVSPTGQQAASNWQAQPLRVSAGANVPATIGGNPLASDPLQQFVNNTMASAGGTSFAAPAKGAGSPVVKMGSPGTGTQASAPKAPVQQATILIQNQQNAQAYTQSIMSNQNVPVVIQPDVVAMMVSNAQMTGNDAVLVQMKSMYDVGPHGQLVPRGTRFLPGAVNDPNMPTNDTLPGSLDYSNILPYGYDSGSNVRGRHGGHTSGGSGGGRTTHTRGTRSNDYNLGLGQ